MLFVRLFCFFFEGAGTGLCGFTAHLCLEEQRKEEATDGKSDKHDRHKQHDGFYNVIITDGNDMVCETLERSSFVIFLELVLLFAF